MADPDLFDVETTAVGPEGVLPLTDSFLRERPSGDVFGLSQNAGMGWEASKVGRDEYLILSTLGGLRADDGSPVALGYHTGHWEIGLLVREAAEELDRLGGLPFAAHVSDPCDGRTQGTTGMFDSLPYRNDAALVLRRLVRSLPNRKGVIGVGTGGINLPFLGIAVVAAVVGTRLGTRYWVRAIASHAAASLADSTGIGFTVTVTFCGALLQPFAEVI